jgi:hypothetical protein
MPARTARSQKPCNGQPVGFLLKTYQILQTESHSHVVGWVDDGIAFKIHNVALFQSSVLPKYFKHSNFSSFVRQLNMYDFHKRKEGECVF